MERMCRETGETRSALVQRLVREKLAEEERRERVATYVCSRGTRRTASASW
jgi:hypothetical protein